MLAKYEPEKIEKKWQKVWAKQGVPKKTSNKGKYYILDMFPYPSGDGLHVGHVENFTATDILARFKRFRGYDVLRPMGWDAFGLPAENFAIKTGIHPAKRTLQSIKNFKRQMQSIGLSYDWSREINTSSSEYYRFTQWMFLFLYKNGLAYKKKAKVNWCESCHTVLANEQVIDGKCDRSGDVVVQKDLEQWFFKITDFIEPTKSGDGKKISGLLSGLEKIDWPESTKAAQKHWIGRSEGAEVVFYVADTEEEIRVFTTRLDTIYGCTYVVVAPEHPLIKNQESRIKNQAEVRKYLAATKKKTDLERTELNKDKTGVCLQGIEVVHPFTGERLPVYVADYVLATYGTGAVMGVPAHDERDFAFAKKYNLQRVAVIKHPQEYEDVDPKTVQASLIEVAQLAEKSKFAFVVVGGVARNIDKPVSQWSVSDLDLFTDQNGFERIKKHFLNKGYTVRDGEEKYGWKNVYSLANEKDWIDVFLLEKEDALYFDTVTGKRFDWDFDQVVPQKVGNTKVLVAAEKLLTEIYFNLASTVDFYFTEDGILTNSGEFSGLTSAEAREKMTAWLRKEKLGKKVVNYRLRDWLISRQRYWGAPIPIIYCDDCALRDPSGQGMYPVPEKDLPVKLPTDVDFRPTGESPLVRSKSFHKVKCPKCGKKARRESDTMDTFVCSSWYYLRFADPNNVKQFASKKALEKYLPVDFYMGGAEHTVLHLLYARFFTKALMQHGHVSFDEPFQKLRHQGIILAPDGNKMSKSKGNVINPDQMVAEFGADSLRLYEMFMGPLEDMKAWNTGNIIGVRRFLEKVWKLSHQIVNDEVRMTNKSLESLIHKTIKKVTEDIEGFKFNTAISSLMILVNTLEKETNIQHSTFNTLLILLSPFAPHIAEELWVKLGEKKSIFLASWPTYDPKKIVAETVKIAVQVNGKVRAIITLDPNASEDEARRRALSDEKVQQSLVDKAVRKCIYVPGRILNFVV